jgi:molybdenum cofactor synthesis domain-containing protein
MPRREDADEMREFGSMPTAFNAGQLLAPRQAIVTYLSRAQLAPPGVEEVELDSALDRVLARDIEADADYPAYARSTMDGFAVSSRHGAKPRRIAGSVIMGRPPLEAMSVAEAMRIPTGGLLPPNADAVIPQEQTTIYDGMLQTTSEVAAGEFITPRGSDFAKGDRALEAGRKLGPAELAVLAALGVYDVPVFRRPRLAVISTGDELVSAVESPGVGQIRDSNRYAICASLRAMGCEAFGIGPIRDDAATLRDTLEIALADFDGAVVSGGSSVGEKDLVPIVTRTLGEPGVIVHGLRVRPGKPTMLGAIGSKPIIGLPGNPTSALMMLEAVVRPAILAYTGQRNVLPAGVVAFAREPFLGREGWTWFMPARLEVSGGRVLAAPLRIHSAHVSLLANAHGYVVIGEIQHRIEAGEPVRVELFSGAGPPVSDGRS